LDSGLACEVINDGIHVHPAITALVARRPESLVLVTDAIDATGVGDGEFELGGQRVRVQDGQARLVGSATLAGSTLTMDDAVRRAVLDCGLPIEVAAAGAATNPARVLGLDTVCGSIAVGLDADLVVLDEDLRVVRVMAGGQWCGAEPPQFNGMATSTPPTN
jgi:N-acetylglucosamine-6-phosphate deacetylase